MICRVKEWIGEAFEPASYGMYSSTKMLIFFNSVIPVSFLVLHNAHPKYDPCISTMNFPSIVEAFCFIVPMSDGTQFQELVVKLFPVCYSFLLIKRGNRSLL